MLINKDLMGVMRRGAWIIKSEQKKQNDSGIVLVICMVLASSLILAVVIK